MHTMIPCPRFTALAVVALTLIFTLPVAAQGTPGVDPNKCLAGKNKCVSKLAASLLKCRELCQKTPDNRCGQAQIDCEQRAREKFDGGAKPEKGCFEKLEAKEDLAKPDSLCTTTGDTAAMGAEVDAAVAEFIARLEGGAAPTCGDGAINAVGEQCDGTDLGGTTCESLNAGEGALACDGACKLDAADCTPATNLVFVTSQIYSATFGATNGALDGDVLCQQHADAAGLDGTFMAWLTDSTTSPATRFVQSTNPYVLVDGTVIADDWAALTNTQNVPLQNPIDLDEFGAAPPPSVGTAPPVDSTVFWSWVAADGTSFSSGPPCGDWGVMIGGFPYSSLGNWTRTDASWSTSFFGGSFTICEGQAPLVCFEQ